MLVGIPVVVEFHCIGKVGLASLLQVAYIKETCAYIESLGYNCQGGSSGSIGEITIYSKVTVNDIQFKYCTLYFYNNTFWKIFYYNTLEEPKTIVSCLERKYDCESDSEDEFYYRNKDLEIQFDGKDLKYISLSVTTSILGDYIRQYPKFCHGKPFLPLR